MNQQLSALRAAFQQCGWAIEQLTGTASKTFDTACAPKLAFVFMAPSGLLTGQYETEARNALASHSWFVDAFDRSLIQEQVSRIDDEISRAVDSTYARSLWLKGLRPRHVVAETVSAH